MAKYQAEIRSMFISVFQQDHFYRDVNPDDAIAMLLTQLEWTYEGMATDLDVGLSNGLPVSLQLEHIAVALGVWIRV